jgi:hypothetical protein
MNALDDELSTPAKIIEIHYNLQYPLILYFFDSILNLEG